MHRFLGLTEGTRTSANFQGGDSALFGLSTFLPVIVQSFDSSYTTLQVQLLTIPVYAWAAACYIAVAAFTDRYGHRAATLCTFATVSVVGFAILLGSQTPGVLYFACFLAACGLYIIVGLNVSYLTVNLAPQLKRATGSGLQLTL